MTKGWKIGLSVLAGSFLLLVLVGGGCLYVLSRFGTETLSERAQRKQAEGENFGKGRDDVACLKEAMARKKGDSTGNDDLSVAGDLVSVTVFLDKCLKNSKPTLALCENVPVPAEIDETHVWMNKKCSEVGDSGWTCESLFRVVQYHCNRSEIPGLKESNK